MHDSTACFPDTPVRPAFDPELAAPLAVLRAGVPSLSAETLDVWRRAALEGRKPAGAVTSDTVRVEKHMTGGPSPECEVPLSLLRPVAQTGPLPVICYMHGGGMVLGDRLGHLEALAAGPAIHRRYRSLGGSPAIPNAVELFKAATEGDGIALRVILAAATGLRRALAGLITCLDPEVVVISGGLANAGPLWWKPLEATVRSELVEALANTPIRPAQLGPTAAILGAARTVAVQ